MKPSYTKLIQERKKLLKKLESFPEILRGSLRQHGNICGNPSCRCKNPKKPILHGPYHYLSHRYQDKTQTIFLNKTKLPFAKKWIANYNRMTKVCYRLSEVNFRILRHHYQKLNSKG